MDYLKFSDMFGTKTGESINNDALNILAPVGHCLEFMGQSNIQGLRSSNILKYIL